MRARNNGELYGCPTHQFGEWLRLEVVRHVKDKKEFGQIALKYHFNKKNLYGLFRYLKYRIREVEKFHFEQKDTPDHFCVYCDMIKEGQFAEWEWEME